MPAYRRYVLAAAALLLAGPALAQDWKGMGRLEGRVLDADGKPLPDVSVKLNLPSRGGGTTVLTIAAAGLKRSLTAAVLSDPVRGVVPCPG